MDALGLANYWAFVALFMIGLYAVFVRTNLIKKIIGLAIFQAAVFLMYITVGKVVGGTAPVYIEGDDIIYANPLPHVLILTAIVVGISMTALALAIVVRIKEEYGTVEEDEIRAMDAEDKEVHS